MEKLCYDNAPIISASLSMDIVISEVAKSVVHPCGLTEIPSLTSITKAKSLLCKQTEVSVKKFIYIKFPMGLMDYNGLKQLQWYHYDLKHNSTIGKIMTWLTETGDLYGINTKIIMEFFSQSSSNHETKLINLTRDNWITENEINELFTLLNQQYEDIMCVVCTPDKCIRDFLISKSKVFQNGKVILALNVGQDHISKSIFISDGIKQGNHWTLLALNTETKLAYYGDSLSWDIPSNLTHMVEPLLGKLGIELKLYNIINLQSNEKKNPTNVCPFYPTQTCSNVCGVIVLCMAAVMCCNWENWYSWNEKTSPQCLVKPSVHSTQLRLSVISWIIERKINTSSISHDFKKRQEINDEICTAEYNSESGSIDDITAHNNYIAAVLPSNYTYKFVEIDYCNTRTYNFKCTFKIQLEN